MTAGDWNEKYPRGTPVRYWPNGKGRGTPVLTKTKRGAYYLGSGSSVVPIESQPLPVSLAVIEPATPVNTPPTV